jgi:acetyl esterase/lipase
MEGARAPDAVLGFYPVLNVELALSASRLMASFDSLLSQGVLETCLEAYVGSETASRGNPLLSPLHATAALLQRLPPTYLVGLTLDPLLDDVLAMATRLHGRVSPHKRGDAKFEGVGGLGQRPVRQTDAFNGGVFVCVGQSWG